MPPVSRIGLSKSVNLWRDGLAFSLDPFLAALQKLSFLVAPAKIFVVFGQRRVFPAAVAARLLVHHRKPARDWAFCCWFRRRLTTF
jgi:hypothetical protein